MTRLDYFMRAILKVSIHIYLGLYNETYKHVFDIEWRRRSRQADACLLAGHRDAPLVISMAAWRRAAFEGRHGREQECLILYLFISIPSFVHCNICYLLDLLIIILFICICFSNRRSEPRPPSFGRGRPRGRRMSHIMICYIWYMYDSRYLSICLSVYLSLYLFNIISTYTPHPQFLLPGSPSFPSFL